MNRKRFTSSFGYLSCADDTDLLRISSIGLCGVPFHEYIHGYTMFTCVDHSCTLISKCRPFIASAAFLWIVTAAAFVQAAAQSGPIDDSRIDQVGERVMQGNEFRSVRRTVLEKLPEADIDKGFLQGALEWFGNQIGKGFSAIGDFFSWLFSGFRSSGSRAPAPATTPSGGYNWDFGFGAFSSAFTIVVILLIAAVLIAIAVMIVKSIDEKKRKQEGMLSDSDDMLSDVTTPPGELAASTYESRALQFASAGDYRAAIRELLLGSMSWIERAGLIRYRKGLTNRDYVRSVWRRVDKRDGYLTTASQFEYVYFGRRTPTVEMFELCLASFQGAFREEEAPTPAV